MNTRTERALLLALEVLLKQGRMNKAKREALEAVSQALTQGGYRMPDIQGPW